MYKKFMDEKAQQIFERLCNKVVNGEFDEDDIYEFYIFIRSYLKSFKGKYKWIREDVYKRQLVPTSTASPRPELCSAIYIRSFRWGAGGSFWTMDSL